MIVIVCSNGDRAETDTAQGAILAAKTLLEEAKVLQGSCPHVTIYEERDDGNLQHIASGLDRKFFNGVTL